LGNSKSQRQLSLALDFVTPLSLSLLSDSKRQQTTTVDYKRLINGFFSSGGQKTRSSIASRSLKHKKKHSVKIRGDFHIGSFFCIFASLI